MTSARRAPEEWREGFDPEPVPADPLTPDDAEGGTGIAGGAPGQAFQVGGALLSTGLGLTALAAVLGGDSLLDIFYGLLTGPVLAYGVLGVWQRRPWPQGESPVPGGAGRVGVVLGLVVAITYFAAAFVMILGDFGVLAAGAIPRVLMVIMAVAALAFSPWWVAVWSRLQREPAAPRTVRNLRWGALALAASAVVACVVQLLRALG